MEKSLHFSGIATISKWETVLFLGEEKIGLEAVFSKMMGVSTKEFDGYHDTPVTIDITVTSLDNELKINGEDLSFDDENT